MKGILKEKVIIVYFIQEKMRLAVGEREFMWIVNDFLWIDEW